MDPTIREPEDMGHDSDGQTPRQRPSREPLASDFTSQTPAPARTARIVTGEFLLTVNPVDGSEIEALPPGDVRPLEGPGGKPLARPRKHTEEERAEREAAAEPPHPPGLAPSAQPLLERQDEREQLVRLLARGCSVRLTGPRGSGRTSLLDLVADDCTDLAPDGVVRLSGFRRSASDLLYDLFHAVYHAPGYRPDEDELRAYVREIGAIVVVDDIEFGGSALDELLEATPECAFLISATPDVPAPSAEADFQEVLLSGLDRAGGVELIERGVGRALTEAETTWAGDLWFESEGLPLRFVQAGALLSQHDRLRASTSAVDEFGVFEDAPPSDVPLDGGAGDDVPLPSLGEAAAPAPLLASRLSASARDTLRFAVALGGEVPHQAHLPALVGDTHADAALGELLSCGLVSPVGSRYRLAAGVLTQLEAAGYGEGAADRVLTAARHYTWWAGHPSVSSERVCAEADAVLAVLAMLVPETRPADAEEASPAVRLARTAAPAFAAGLAWSAWERTLRFGAEASRLAGNVAEQAYFHHELGILALCGGRLDRARAELEASIGLRGALADKRGTVAGRRALALVADRSGTAPVDMGLAALGATVGEEVPDARTEESASPPGEITVPLPALQPPGAAPATPPGPAGGPARHRVGFKGLARRNLVAAGAGTLLAAGLGTVVTLGATSHNDANTPADKVKVNPSAGQDTDDGTLDADAPARGDTGTATSRPAGSGPGGTREASGDPTAPGDAEPSESARPSGTGESPGSPSTSPGTPGESGSSTGGTSGGSSGGSTGGSPGGSTGGSSGGSPSGGTGAPTGGASGEPSGGTSGEPSGGASGEPSGGTSGEPTGGTTGETTGGSSPSSSASASAPVESSSPASAPADGGTSAPGGTGSPDMVI
ncbi:ATP-binding protein [Streptomyces thermoalcalitolerans]|uniref:ATP-binding protein n=1 Tax=Streptomyces thermoalcalitolerans TaxID=65605 RepID=A0ABN1NRJ0_9ACTN